MTIARQDRDAGPHPRAAGQLSRRRARGWNAMTDIYSVSTGQKVGTIQNAPLYCYSSELAFLEMDPADNMVNIIAYTP